MRVKTDDKTHETTIEFDGDDIDLLNSIRKITEVAESFHTVAAGLMTFSHRSELSKLDNFGVPWITSEKERTSVIIGEMIDPAWFTIAVDYSAYDECEPERGLIESLRRLGQNYIDFANEIEVQFFGETSKPEAIANSTTEDVAVETKETNSLDE